jgi:hypothetical protein
MPKPLEPIVFHNLIGLDGKKIIIEDDPAKPIDREALARAGQAGRENAERARELLAVIPHAY